MSERPSLRDIPSVDDVLKTEVLAAAVASFGRPATVGALRKVIERVRAERLAGRPRSATPSDVAHEVMARLEAEAVPKIRPVFNLTGTILHTNLGRALLAEAAIGAATTAMREVVALEFDLATGKRRERDGYGSEVGSGALPQQTIASAGLAIRPAVVRKRGRALSAVAAAFRRLPVPVIGRIAEQSLILDLHRRSFAEQ